jgi:hypothetical protein
MIVYSSAASSGNVNKDRNLARGLSCKVIDTGGNGKWVEQGKTWQDNTGSHPNIRTSIIR